MNSNSRIFWFSGTGNSLYAARILSEELGGVALERITEAPPAAAAGGEGSIVGFVFPSYYCNLPRPVKAFVERLEMLPGAYVFAVVTMGAVGQGSVASMARALSKKGVSLDYGRSVVMPANNVTIYDPGDPEGSGAKLTKAAAKIRAYAAEIAAGERSVKSLPFAMNTLYKDAGGFDKNFHVTGDCDGCGTCAKVCPAADIDIKNGKPEWLNRCERCMACISWCPQKAVEYGNKTQVRRRYRNPFINAGDLAR